jgi:hypothetical protein
MLSIILYGCESITLKERTPSKFGKWILRRIFSRKRNKIMGDWRKLHDEELHNLYFSPNAIEKLKSRRMRRIGHVARMSVRRNAYRAFDRKTRRK